MKNSFFIRFIASIASGIKNSYFNSFVYKKIEAKREKSKSTIIRKLMDEDILSNTKSYTIIKRLNPKSTNRTTSSKVLNSLFLDEVMNTMVITAVAILLTSFALGFNLKRTLVLALICILTKAFQIIVNKKYYESSLIYKFFVYAYKLER